MRSKMRHVHETYYDFMSNWEKRMQEAYKIAAKTAHKGAVCGKAHYDRKVQEGDLQPGDGILLRNLTPRGGPGKI